MRFHKVFVVFVVLFVITGCQSVVEAPSSKPKYIKKISAELDNEIKHREAHKIVAEYNAETGEFYQFEKDHIFKYSIYIGHRPQSSKDLNLLADDLSVVFNDMVKLDVCDGEPVSKELKWSNFMVTCIGSGTPATPQIVWVKCSEFTTVCESDVWTIKEMREMETLKTKMRNTNILSK
jgi:hypothetical protein